MVNLLFGNIFWFLLYGLSVRNVIVFCSVFWRFRFIIVGFRNVIVVMKMWIFMFKCNGKDRRSNDDFYYYYYLVDCWGIVVGLCILLVNELNDVNDEEDEDNEILFLYVFFDIKRMLFDGCYRFNLVVSERDFIWFFILKGILYYFLLIFVLLSF